ncbi:MAG TPA: AMP-binding protein [Pseudogracilibacillus sp.]|nr:AMP-binding protein [Pseudogracilibacillus sp.]
MNQQSQIQVDKLVEQHDYTNLSLAHVLCERHDQEKIAFYFESEGGEKKTFTYGELNNLSKKFASVLKKAGVRKGSRVAVLLPKGPETFISALAMWRLGAVYVPLFTAFERQAISFRLKHSEANVVLTDLVNRPKLSAALDDLANTDINVITLNCETEEDIDYWDALEQAEPYEEATLLTKEDTFILIYTSGTTGDPKGVEVPVFALSAFEAYMRFGLHVQEDDLFWNIADPGWAYGLYYGVVGPFILGQSFIVYQGRFNVDTTYRILRDYKVTNFTGAPTVYRTMRVAGTPEYVDELNLQTLSSAGEPLNPDINNWTEEVFHSSIYDHYGQTELGMAIVNHHHPMFQHEIKLGSMGRALPGYRAVILDDEFKEVEAGVEGELAFDINESPLLWFRGYLNDEARTAKQYSPCKKYYLTGDAASVDEDGMFFFSGRDDDIIISSGYKIGPFEVESSLMEHESVAETAVVGIPDDQRGEIVKAFVILRPDYKASDELAKELSEFVKKNLSAHEYPREVEFLEELPKTPSGKVQRYLLRKI